MQIDVKPYDIKEVTVHVRKRGCYKNGTTTIPAEILDRYNINSGDKISLVFLCKVEEDKDK